MKNSKNSVVNAPTINLLKDVVPIRQCTKEISYNNNNKPNNIVVSNEMICEELVVKIKYLLKQVETFGLNKKQKVITATEIFSLLNREMMKHEKLYKTNRFVLTVYNKTFELEKSVTLENFEVDKNLVEKFVIELKNIRPVLEKLILNMNDCIFYQPILNSARKFMNRCQRPKRNIQPVNYAGMDMNSEDIGEICVFKPWFEDGKLSEKCFKRPLSLANELDDEDYIFEEDEDEEEYTKEQFCKKIWAKVHPETPPTLRRTTRIKKQVKYTGMDIDHEEEELTIYRHGKKIFI